MTGHQLGHLVEVLAPLAVALTAWVRAETALARDRARQLVDEGLADEPGAAQADTPYPPPKTGPHPTV